MDNILHLPRDDSCLVYAACYISYVDSITHGVNGIGMVLVNSISTK